jgi:hypothetical protein
MVMRPVTDPDIWWHLRTGEWVVQNGRVTDTDPFSMYGHDKPWVAYSWLFEVLIYRLYQAFGLTGILAYRVALSAALLIAIHRLVLRREPRVVPASFLTALAFASVVPLLSERPWLFTLLLTVVTLEVVLRMRDGSATRAVWLLPMAFVLWANVHIQFIYGLAVLGLACLAPLGDSLLGRPLSGTAADTPGTRQWWRLVGLTAVCTLATLVNPYGARLYYVVYEYASQTVPFSVINELLAPDFRVHLEWGFLALAGIGVFALGRRAKPSLFDVLLMAGMAFLAFRARRDMGYLAVASLAVITTGPRPAAEAAERFALTPARIAVTAAAVGLFMVLTCWYQGLSESSMKEAVAREYPVAACDFIRRANPPYPGPLFNDFNWGGYLIWDLRDYPVSMDGRTNLHGDERLALHVKTTHGVNWQKDPDLTSARLIIAERDGPVAAILQESPRYRRVYADEGDAAEKEPERKFAAVFIRLDTDADGSRP